MRQRPKITQQVQIDIDNKPKSPPIKRLYRLKRTLLIANAFSHPDSSSQRDFEFWESEKLRRHELNHIRKLDQVVQNMKLNILKSSTLMNQQSYQCGIKQIFRKTSKLNKSFQDTFKMEPIIDTITKLRKKSCECSQCGLPCQKEVQSSINLNNEIRYFTIRRIKRRFRKLVWAVVALIKYKQIMEENVQHFKQFINKRKLHIELPTSHHKVPSVNDSKLAHVDSPAIQPSKLLKRFNSQTMMNHILKPVIKPQIKQVVIPDHKPHSNLYIHDQNHNRQGSVTKYLSEKIMERIKTQNVDNYQVLKVEIAQQVSIADSPKIKKIKQPKLHLKLNLPNLKVPYNFSINSERKAINLRQREPISPYKLKSPNSMAQQNNLYTERFTSYTQHSSIYQSRIGEADMIPLIKYQSYASLIKLRKEIVRTKSIQNKNILPRAMILK